MKGVNISVGLYTVKHYRYRVRELHNFIGSQTPSLLCMSTSVINSSHYEQESTIEALTPFFITH
jgi:hypothetical protein